ncbi:hypothetical protein ACISN4_01810, partial [Campylobacter jejuni]
MFKSLNIGLKLIFSVAAVVVIGLVILISLITKQVSQNITKNTEDILASITKEYATQTQGIFGEMIALNKSISGTLTDVSLIHFSLSFSIVSEEIRVLG